MRRPWRPRSLFARSEWRVSRVYWLVLLLITFWVFLHRIAPYDAPTPPAAAVQDGPFVVILLVAYANLSFRSWARIRRAQERLSREIYARLGWFFVLIDFALVAFGLRYSGAERSPLWIVFFVVVVAETLLATVNETGLIRAGAALALVVGTLPTPHDLGVPSLSGLYFARLVTSGYVLDLITRFLFLIAVSSVTRHLRENAAATDRENAALRAEIALAEERANLSREIHDGVGNSLAAAVLRLEVAARTLEKRRGADGEEQDAAAPLLREEARALREAMTAVRDWTFFTRPWQSVTSSGESGGDSAAGPSPAALLPASQVLATEADRLSRRTGLPIHVAGADTLDALPAPTRLAVLRITQEALTNAAKYAQGASAARVTARRDPAAGEFVLTVADDGCGFDPAAAGAGVGLSSMRERAQASGGTLAVESAPGQGVTVTARLPA